MAKADRNGTWLKSWGDRGDKPGEFNTPHNIAADAQGNVYVADRFNRRIQVFDGEGNFLRAITIDVPFDHDARPAIGGKPDPEAKSGTFAPGAPWTVCITPPPNQWVLFTSDAYLVPSLQAVARRQGAGRARASRASSRSSSSWIPPRSPAHRSTRCTSPKLLNWRVQKLILH